MTKFAAAKKNPSKTASEVASVNTIGKILPHIKRKFTDKKSGVMTAKYIHNDLTKLLNKVFMEDYGIKPAAMRTMFTTYGAQTECMMAQLAEAKYNVGPNKLSLYKKTFDDDTFDKMEVIDQSKLPIPIQVHTMILADVIDPITRKKEMKGRKIKKKMTRFLFEPSRVHNCGQCWLCDVMVKAFYGTVGSEGFQTPCGDCEHICGVIASLIADMLASSGNPATFWRSYLPSCVECNRTKSNYIGVKLTATGWQVDLDGVDFMLNEIFGSIKHGVWGGCNASEYNPDRIKLTADLLASWNTDQAYFKSFIAKRRKAIIEQLQLWCDLANKAFSTNPKHPINQGMIIHVLGGILTNIINKFDLKMTKQKTPPRSHAGGGWDDDDGDGDSEDEADVIHEFGLGGRFLIDKFYDLTEQYFIRYPPTASSTAAPAAAAAPAPSSDNDGGDDGGDEIKDEDIEISIGPIVVPPPRAPDILYIEHDHNDLLGEGEKWEYQVEKLRVLLDEHISQYTSEGVKMSSAQLAPAPAAQLAAAQLEAEQLAAASPLPTELTPNSSPKKKNETTPATTIATETGTGNQTVRRLRGAPPVVVAGTAVRGNNQPFPSIPFGLNSSSNEEPLIDPYESQIANSRREPIITQNRDPFDMELQEQASDSEEQVSGSDEEPVPPP